MESNPYRTPGDITRQATKVINYIQIWVEIENEYVLAEKFDNEFKVASGSLYKTYSWPSLDTLNSRLEVYLNLKKNGIISNIKIEVVFQ